MKELIFGLTIACGLLHHISSEAKDAYLFMAFPNCEDDEQNEGVDTKKYKSSKQTSKTKNKYKKNNNPPPDNRKPNPYFIPKRFDMGYAEGDRTRFKLGYSHLAMVLAPEYKVGKFLPMINLKGIAFNNGTFSAAGGFVGRFLPKSWCEIFGFNLFYEWRQGKVGNFNQVEGGLEILNKNWEIRAQGCVPVGPRNHKSTTVFADGLDSYRAVRVRNEFASYFVYASAGYYIVNTTPFQIYLAAGPYWFTGKFNHDVWGGQATFRPQIMNYIELEFNISYDRVFKTSYQGSIIFTLPLYSYSSAIRKKRGPCGMANWQIYQPVRRDELILLTQKCCWTVTE